MIVDTPDLDTVATEHRAATRALLKAAGLVVYVFSPERYLEERAWSVIREEQRYSACLAVLSQSDTVPPQTLDRIADELRHRFAAPDQPEIKLLRVCAARHVPGTGEGDGPTPSLGDGVDEWPRLRAALEHELEAGEVARLVRQQRARVLDHLRDLTERAIGPDLAGRLARLDAAAGRAEELRRALAHELADRLAAVEAELAPLATRRWRRRFWGPFRLWLAASDFLIDGLPRLGDRLRYDRPGEPVSVVEALLATARVDRVEDLLRSAARKLHETCYAHRLPVDPWRAIKAEAHGAPLLAAVAQRIASRFEALGASTSRGDRFLIAAVAALGAAAPAGLALLGLTTLLGNLARGRFGGGLELLGVLVTITLLFDAVLHGLVSLASSGRAGSATREIGARALHDAVRHTLEGWVAAYRVDLEADVADLHGALAALQGAVADPEHVVSPPRPAAPDRSPADPPGPAPPGPEPVPPPRDAAALLREAMTRRAARTRS